MGRAIAGPEKARDASAGSSGWRRGVGFLEGAKGRIPRDRAPARLGAQNRQRARRVAQKRAWEGQEGPKGDNAGGEQGPSEEGHRGVRKGVRDQVAQGGQEDHRRRRGLARLLRLSGRALEAPEDNQPDRVAVRHREGQDGHNEGTRKPGGGGGDDLQAVGGSRREVAKAERLPAGTPGEGRGRIHKRRASRKSRREGSRVIGVRSTTFDDTSARLRTTALPSP